MSVYQNYVMIFIEMSSFLIFNTAFSEFKLRFPKWVHIIWLFVMSSVGFVIDGVFVQNFFLKQMAIIIVFIIGSIVIGKKSLKNAVIISTLFDFIFLAADMITILIDRDVFQIDMNGQSHIDAFVTLMSKSVLLIFVLIFKKIGSNRCFHISGDRDVLFFSVFPLISSGAIAGVLKCGVGLKSESEIQFAWVVLVSLIAMNILIIFLWMTLLKRQC